MSHIFRSVFFLFWCIYAVFVYLFSVYFFLLSFRMVNYYIEPGRYSNSTRKVHSRWKKIYIIQRWGSVTFAERKVFDKIKCVLYIVLGDSWYFKNEFSHQNYMTFVLKYSIAIFFSGYQFLSLILIGKMRQKKIQKWNPSLDWKKTRYLLLTQRKRAKT